MSTEPDRFYQFRGFSPKSTGEATTVSRLTLDCPLAGTKTRSGHLKHCKERWGRSMADYRRLRAVDGATGLRPERCWNDCLERRNSIRPCVPSHVAYEVGAARQQTVRSPRTMDPNSKEWNQNREATGNLPAKAGPSVGLG